jgi:transcription antitermination protein NusB
MFRIKHCREIVLKILYQIDILQISGDEDTQIIDNYFQSFRAVNPDEEQFIRNMIRRIHEKRGEIDRLISENLIGWKMNRLSPINRSLLRMGIAESHFNDQKAVIIDDVIRIAQKYGAQDDFKFINAILDKVIP